jgi:competence protein ComEC
MPLGAMAFLLMPFGLDKTAFYWIGQGVDIILQIAHWVANLRGAVWHLSALPPIALAFFAIGFAWLCIWQKPWRLLGVVIIAAGFLTLPLQPQADLMVAPGGKVMALRDESAPAKAGGHYIFQGSGRENYFTETWAQWFGIDEGDLDIDRDQPEFHCDDDKCWIARGGQTVALIKTEAGFYQSCAGGAKILMTIKQLPDFHGQCAHAQIIRYWDSMDKGTYAFYFRDNVWQFENVSDRRGDRPWVR